MSSGAVQILLLGGAQDWPGGSPSKENWIATLNAAAKAAYRGITQNAYQILKQGGDIDNQDAMGADLFSSRAGVKSTIDTTNSTAWYPESLNAYILPADDDAGSDTTHDPDSFTNLANAFDGDSTTYAENTSGSVTSFVHELGKTFSAKTVTYVRYKYTASHEGGAINAATVAKLQTYNGSTWSDHTTLTNTEDVIAINSSIQGVRLEITMTSDNSKTKTCNVYLLQYGDTYASGNVETNQIISLPAAPKAVAVYMHGTFGSEITSTLDVSDDGGTSFDITAQASDNGRWFFVNTATLTGTSLALQFNFATSSNTVTMQFEGYSVYVVF